MSKGVKNYFQTLSKISVSYEDDEIYWSNGHDDGYCVDIDKYTIIYNDVNGVEITFYIEVQRDEMVIRTYIKIGSWIHFILCDHNDEEIGYYDNEDKREFSLLNVKEMTNYYEKSNIKDDIGMSRFYSAFFSILTEEILSDLNTTLNEPLCFYDTFSEIEKYSFSN